MLEELDKLIQTIQKEYERLFLEWEEKNRYKSFNQKKTLVKDIVKNNEILEYILSYRIFLNENHIDLKYIFNNLNLKCEINSRVKLQNSIEYKLNNYMTEKHEYGEVALNKCFNDLYGIRIIFIESVEFQEIKKFINKKYLGRLKCYDASKDKYKATHIYFKNGNKSFQWELQIWNKEDEKTNIMSHELYKQDYTKWENENKEVVSHGDTLYNNEQ